MNATGLDHTEFEILLEKRIRGEDSPEERASLDHHLAGCAECRRALEDAVEATRAVRARLAAATARVDWARMERGLRAELDGMRATQRVWVWCSIAAPLLVLGVNLGMVAPILGWRWAVNSAATMAGVMACFGLAQWARMRSMARRLETEASSVDAAWAAELRRRRWRVRFAEVYSVAFLLALLVTPMVAQHLWPVMTFLPIATFFVVHVFLPSGRRRRRLYTEGLIDMDTLRSRKSTEQIERELGR